MDLLKTKAEIKISLQEIQCIEPQRKTNMPYYKFFNHETNEEYIQFMGISEADTFLENNPHIERKVNGAPGLHSGIGLGGGLKVDSGFNDLLGRIKGKHSESSTIGGNKLTEKYNLSRSTIQTK